MFFNPSIHNRRSIRMQGWDYSQAGLYFVTICVFKKKSIFGDIVSGKMIFNDAGKIANDCWLEIPIHFPNVVLHEHIIMPNHVHGIIELHNNGDITDTVGVENFQPLQSQSQQPQQKSKFQHPQQNEFQNMIPHSIGAIVKGFKIGVTKWVRNNGDIQTVWQRNYWDHIIRDEQSYQRIAYYIANNPAKWQDDKLFI